MKTCIVLLCAEILLGYAPVAYPKHESCTIYMHVGNHPRIELESGLSRNAATRKARQLNRGEHPSIRYSVECR
jgi:hypothetical protein